MKAHQENRDGKPWLGLLLAWVAGGVDAVGFLTLFHLFTAHMSGNSVAAGAYAGIGQWTEAARRVFPIPVFMVGVALGAVLMETGTRRSWRTPQAWALLLEAALLTAFLLVGSRIMTGGSIRATPVWRFDLVAGLLPLAMGVQNAALRRVAGRSVRTTYITGMLTEGMEQAVTFLFWLRDRVRGRGLRRLARVLSVASRQKSWGGLVIPLGIWLCYMAGAVLASVAEAHWQLKALLLPLSGLAVAVAADLAQPSANKTRR